MGTLYDAVYSFVGREVDPCTFGVYWREPQYDPPVRSDSSKNGGFEISLSQFDEDVAVVVILSTEEPEWGDTPAYISPDTTTREQLVGRFLPEEWEERPVGLTWANSQCWFG
jgi:hypothetical protein